MLATNIPWDEEKMLPIDFGCIIEDERAPYYPEEIGFYRSHTTEEDRRKGTGKIYIYYNPLNGQASYSMTKQKNEPYGPFGTSIITELQTKQTTKKSLDFHYVVWQVAELEGLPHLVLRLFGYHVS